jgi:hypothetical protein
MWQGKEKSGVEIWEQNRLNDIPLKECKKLEGLFGLCARPFKYEDIKGPLLLKKATDFRCYFLYF